MWQLRKLYLSYTDTYNVAYVGESLEKARAAGINAEQWLCAVQFKPDGKHDIVRIVECMWGDSFRFDTAVRDLTFKLDDLVVDPKAWVARVDAEFDALHDDITVPATSRSS